MQINQMLPSLEAGSKIIYCSVCRMFMGKRPTGVLKVCPCISVTTDVHAVISNCI